MDGITINIDPVIADLGAFALRWYSLAFAGGIAIAVLLIMRHAKERGLDANKVGNVALWAVVAGVIGARLFHVLDKLDFYLDNPHHILMVTQGGLAIWGGLLTGGVVALLVARSEGLPLARVADIAPIGLLAGQMVGRLGCIINGDAYGGATGLPWGFVYVNPGAMLPDALRGIPTHPYPVYEILWNLGLLGLLLFLRRRPLPAGMLFLTYAAGYALARFSLTFVRQEDAVLWGLQQAQVVALAALALAAAGMIYVVLRVRSSAAQGAQRTLAGRKL